jgi:hypothetical protein
MNTILSTLIPCRLANARTNWTFRRQVRAVNGNKDSRPLIVILDAENLSISAQKNYGLGLDYRALLRDLSSRFQIREGHAVFSQQPGDNRWNSYFSRVGIVPHPRLIREFRTPYGIRRSCNSDLALAVLAGNLATAHDADFLIGSGDGELVTETLSAIKAIRPGIRGYAAGIPGAIAARLKSEPHVDAVIEIGRSCLIQSQAA